MPEELEVTEDITVEQVMSDMNKLKSKNEQLIGINKKMANKLEEMESGKKQLLEKMQGEEERRLIESGDFDSLVNMRSQQVLNAKDEALRDFERKYENATRELDMMRIGSLARDAAIQSGIRPEAQEEIMLMVSQRFRMEDGRVVGYSTDGAELLDKNGEQMSMAEYIQSLAPTKGYLFATPTGGGAYAGPGNVPGATKKSLMSREAKSDFVQKHGYEKYMALPA